MKLNLQLFVINKQEKFSTQIFSAYFPCNSEKAESKIGEKKITGNMDLMNKITGEKIFFSLEISYEVIE